MKWPNLTLALVFFAAGNLMADEDALNSRIYDLEREVSELKNKQEESSQAHGTFPYGTSEIEWQKIQERWKAEQELEQIRRRVIEHNTK